MHFTNNFKIRSKSTIEALMYDGYDLKDRPENVLSCTEILDAPKIKILQSRHSDDIVVDLSRRFWTMDGTAIHYVIESSNKENGNRLSEERLFLKITNGAIECFSLKKDWSITDSPMYDKESTFVAVKFDQYDPDEEVVEDNKRTSVWEVVYGIRKNRIEQLNIGALALRLIGFGVGLIRSVLYLKDWTKRDYESAAAKGDTKYPPIPYYEHDSVPATIEDAIEIVKSRANMHRYWKAFSDDAIPECSPEERWLRGESFAVMKEGNKAAKRLFRVEGEMTTESAKKAAAEYMASLMSGDTKGKYYVEHRPGVNVRCMDYCEVRQWCHFGRELKGGNDE